MRIVELKIFRYHELSYEAKKKAYFDYVNLVDERKGDKWRKSDATSEQFRNITTSDNMEFYASGKVFRSADLK